MEKNMEEKRLTFNTISDRAVYIFQEELNKTMINLKNAINNGDIKTMSECFKRAVALENNIRYFQGIQNRERGIEYITKFGIPVYS